MKSLWRKLPWWGKLLEILIILGVVGFIGYWILKYIVPIIIGVVVLFFLWAFATSKSRRSREVYYEEEEPSNEVHVYHHRDPSSGRAVRSSGGVANRGLYSVNVNKRGAEFIGGKMKRPRLW